MNEPARLLQEALDVLDHGERWIKGDFEDFVRDEEGEPIRKGYCSIGAVRVATRRNQFSLDSIYYTMAKDALAYAISGGLAVLMSDRGNDNRIARFNDATDTTWEDVALMFKKAINHLDP